MQCLCGFNYYNLVSRAEYYVVFLSNLSFDELLIPVFFPIHSLRCFSFHIDL